MLVSQLCFHRGGVTYRALLCGLLSGRNMTATLPQPSDRGDLPAPGDQVLRLVHLVSLCDFKDFPAVAHKPLDTALRGIQLGLSVCLELSLSKFHMWVFTLSSEEKVRNQ